VVVGRIGAPVGLDGSVRVWSYTDPPQALLDYGDLTAGMAGRDLTLVLRGGAVRGRSLVARFEGVDDRTAAGRLTGAELSVARARLPSLPPGEYYWADLEGLAVTTLEGAALGTVVALLETGANDVLVVRDGARERLIPYLRDTVVRAVDPQAGTLTVDWDAEF
jgi:16S rRNA processing protein RimM